MKMKNYKFQGKMRDRKKVPVPGVRIPRHIIQKQVMKKGCNTYALIITNLLAHNHVILNRQKNSPCEYIHF